MNSFFLLLLLTGRWRCGGLPPGVADSVPGVILHDPDDGTVHAVHNRTHVPQPASLGLRTGHASHRIGSLPAHASTQVITSQPPFISLG